MMSIELTAEQRRTLQAEHGRPVEVVDPVTAQHYVLVAREEYERVLGFLETTLPTEAPPVSTQIAPLMLQSQQAFWRDLPELLNLKSKKRLWVAYHGDERIGFGETDGAIYQECLRRGLHRGEFYVGRIEKRDTPPWGTVPLERSLYEAADVPPCDPSSPAV